MIMRLKIINLKGNKNCDKPKKIKRRREMRQER